MGWQKEPVISLVTVGLRLLPFKSGGLLSIDGFNHAGLSPSVFDVFVLTGHGQTLQRHQQHFLNPPHG